MGGSTGPMRMGASRARQGRWGRHMLWVLAISVVLGVVALAGAWVWISGDLSRAEHRSSATPRDAAAFHAPAPSGG